MTPKAPTLLLNLASAAGLLGAGLFFIGYIYRWSYFGYFQLGIHTLELPIETFLLVPLQVLFGNPRAIVNTIIVALLIPCLFWISQLLSALIIWIVLILSTRLRNAIIDLSNHITETQQAFIPLSPFKPSRTLPLLQESIVLLWVLLLMFHVAFQQGQLDARRDAVDDTSVLPMVTLIGDKDLMILGVNPKTLDPEENYPAALRPEDQQSLIGNPDFARGVQESSINEDQQVWRLLMESGGWIYLIRTVPSDDPEQYPLVVSVAKSSTGRQMMLLTPNPPEEKIFNSQ